MKVVYEEKEYDVISILKITKAGILTFYPGTSFLDHDNIPDNFPYYGMKLIVIDSDFYIYSLNDNNRIYSGWTDMGINEQQNALSDIYVHSLVLGNM